MDKAAEIVERHFAVRNRELLLGGIGVTELVRIYGTPLFVYDTSVLQRKLTALRSALGTRFSIHYSVKANPNLHLLKFFLENGCGLEIASLGELHQALSAGCPAHKIIFAGPGKTEAELQAAAAAGIGEIHVESATEVRRLGLIAAKLGRPIPVSIRVNPSAEAQGGAMRMGGKPAPFGIDEEQLEPVLKQIMRETGLALHGIHLFTGTQILDASILITQYRKAIEIARRVVELTGIQLTTVDFGGGLGIPYFSNDNELDLSAVSSGISELMREIEQDPVFRGTSFVVEPGRFLVGESGVYITQVSDVKESRGKKFVIVDGGMHHHLAASGNLGQTIKRNYPVAVLNKVNAEQTGAVEVVGPLCTPLDVLARNVSLPPVAIGDLIGVFQSGAYARAASPLNFLSHPAPAEVIVDHGQHRLIRRRGSVEDYTRDIEKQVVATA
ncbi:MAG TPA: diaminopimelate decarboxylase [Terriglobales bacterium]|nr:diaminopimelate decarboxylase [Terriglobales bacterium]